MSEENLDALKRLYADWAAGDWSDNSMFDPYAVGVLPDPTPRALFGLDALGEYMRRFLDSWDDIHMEAASYRQAGDTFVVCVRRIGRGKASGVQIEDRSVHLWTFRGTKVIRLELFEKESEALEAAGLAE